MLRHRRTRPRGPQVGWSAVRPRLVHPVASTGLFRRDEFEALLQSWRHQDLLDRNRSCCIDARPERFVLKDPEAGRLPDRRADQSLSAWATTCGAERMRSRSSCRRAPRRTSPLGESAPTSRCTQRPVRPHRRCVEQRGRSSCRQQEDVRNQRLLLGAARSHLHRDQTLRHLRRTAGLRGQQVIRCLRALRLPHSPSSEP